MKPAENLSIEFCVLAKTKKYEWLLDGKQDLLELNKLYNKLKDINLDELKNDDEKKAFWINIYNGLMCYFIIEMNITESLSKESIFKSKKANIGGHEWSLDNIEHGILRKNKRPVNSFKVPFGKYDKRKAYMVNEKDSRIHFALNCGAKSCPAIRAYTSKNINEELKKSEETFLQFETNIDHKSKVINASKIFKWYKSDFANQYIYAEKFKTYKIKYKEYNWNLI